MWDALHRAVHGLPFEQPIPESLEAEFRSWPARRRRQLLRKAAQRELLIHLTGQGRRLCRTRAPEGVRRMLWWNPWTTIGDALMDLSARARVPADIEIELLIPPALAPLFANDSRFRRVHESWSTVGRDFDFLLVGYHGREVLRAKLRHLPQVPFATLHGHLAGEMFSRTHAADARIRQLFGLAPGEPSPPRLDLPAADVLGDLAPQRVRIAVALGARDPRRRYPHWLAALTRVADAWPGDLPAPCFVLLGAGNARDDVASLEPLLRRQLAADRVDRQTVLQAAQTIAACDFFVGADGGPMHLAVATGRPGVALFGPVPPEYRLLPGSTMVPLQPVAGQDHVSAAVLGQAIVDGVQRAAAHGGLGNAHHLHA